jgi:hypothetical protein
LIGRELSHFRISAGLGSGVMWRSKFADESLFLSRNFDEPGELAELALI